MAEETVVLHYVKQSVQPFHETKKCFVCHRTINPTINGKDSPVYTNWEREYDNPPPGFVACNDLRGNL